MAGVLRKYHGDGFKFKVALTAARGNKSVAEMVQEFGVAANQISAWKKQLEDNGAVIFSDKRLIENKESEMEKLYATIGRLVVERNCLAQSVGQLK